MHGLNPCLCTKLRTSNFKPEQDWRSNHVTLWTTNIQVELLKNGLACFTKNQVCQKNKSLKKDYNRISKKHAGPYTCYLGLDVRVPGSVRIEFFEFRFFFITYPRSYSSKFASTDRVQIYHIGFGSALYHIIEPIK